MSLIRRSKTPTPAERALGIARLGLKALVAQRVARKAHKGYKIGRKLPLILGAGAVAFVVAKKAKGSSSPAPAAPPNPTPPSSGSSPHTGTTPPPKAEPTSASNATEPVAVAEGSSSDGAPSPEPAGEDAALENTPKVEEILDTEATTPLTPSAAGTGGAEGEGVPTDEESAEASGESTDAAPPKD
jgi:hypothetical protein